MMWSGRVEQELGCAARANDVSARKAHLELAVLHLEADDDTPPRAREMLEAALFTRVAFGED
jgi:hypothetical protein